MSVDWLPSREELNEAPESPDEGLIPWKLLVVDDEEEVHRATRLALKKFTFDGRPVEQIKAMSGKEAIEQLESTPDIAVMFLDVVMETDDAGLRVVEHVRNQLGNRMIRIVIRTGQAGRAPEMEVVTRYDINGYREKTEMTSEKLLSQLYTALSSYRDLKLLNEEKEHRKTAADELVSQFAHSEELRRRIVAFAKAASHDLQEPVRKTVLWADRLAERLAEVAPEVSGDAEKIKSHTERIAKQIDEMRQNFFIESGSAEREKLKIENILLSFSGSRDEDLVANPVRFEITDRPLPEIMADRASMNLLITGLIEAFHFFDQPEPIKVSAEEVENRRLRLTMTDKGTGIEPGELERIFEPYANAVINGTPHRGMGLYLAKRIARVHGGDISIESSPGSGSRIHIDLPIA